MVSLGCECDGVFPAYLPASYLLLSLFAFGVFPFPFSLCCSDQNTDFLDCGAYACIFWGLSSFVVVFIGIHVPCCAAGTMLGTCRTAPGIVPKASYSLDTFFVTELSQEPSSL